MAQPSLMELASRTEIAASALSDAEPPPTTAQLVAVFAEVGCTCRHLARAAERLSGWAQQLAERDSAAAADGPGALEELRQLAIQLSRCEGATSSACDALLELGRNP